MLFLFLAADQNNFPLRINSTYVYNVKLQIKIEKNFYDNSFMSQ